MSNSIHDSQVRINAISLLRAGLSNREVASQLGVPGGTIGYWKHLDRQLHPESYPLARWESCPACHGHTLDNSAYAYVLGLYLGDGHIIDKYKQHTLSIFCADAWPGLIEAAEQAMRQVMPGPKTGRVQRKGCTEVKSYSRHWVCMLPQHGRGKKHERPVVLQEWQEYVVEQHTREFVRGLIHSDGCRVTNWTTRMVAGLKKRYEYPRYHFTNESGDIRNLFTGALDDLGIEWRYNNRNCISVAKRDSVAAMDTFVGPKY